jgi:hypothetical protein
MHFVGGISYYTGYITSLEKKYVVGGKIKNVKCVTSKELLFGKIKEMERIKIYHSTLTMSEVIKSTVTLFLLDNDNTYIRLSQHCTSFAILNQGTKRFYNFLKN